MDVTPFPEVGIRVVGAGAIVEAGVKTIVDLHRAVSLSVSAISSMRLGHRHAG